MWQIDEFAWWMGGVNPSAITPLLREKLLMRQRALMRLAKELMLQSDDGQVREREAGRASGVEPGQTSETVTGEIHLHCPVCRAPLCLVIAGAHLVAGVEME